MAVYYYVRGKLEGDQAGIRNAQHSPYGLQGIITAALQMKSMFEQFSNEEFELSCYLREGVKERMRMDGVVILVRLSTCVMCFVLSM